MEEREIIKEKKAIEKRIAVEKRTAEEEVELKAKKSQEETEDKVKMQEQTEERKQKIQETENKVEAYKKKNQNIYIVAQNDNIEKIAEKYNIDWKELYARNKFVIGNNPSNLKKGQVLRIR